MFTAPPPEEETQVERDKLVNEGFCYGEVTVAGPIPIKIKFFGIKNDWACPDTCKLVLIKCFNSAAWVRYPKYSIEYFSPERFAAENNFLKQ